MIRLNHIGVAVQDAVQVKKLFSLLGLEVDHQERVSEQGVMTYFLPLPMAQSSLELLEAEDPEGVIGRFIRKRGPGLHHLSFQVDKGGLEFLSSRLRQDGYRLVYERPKVGAQGALINFIHPASAGGLLIEVMEQG